MSQRDEVIDGRYRLVELIGSGGMGVVWRAHDERLGRDVAVKRLHLNVGPDPEQAEIASQRAMREARITAKLHHPNAVPVFDVVEHEGRPCLVMQYFPSSDLAELSARGRTLPATEVARIGGDVAAALAAAHELGIVHRDVKPANVLVAPDGTAKISDFGIAHAVGDASLTSTGLVTGTPAYLAPEVARGEGATPASDVFSLGSTLYSVLEGRTPFGAHENSMALLHRVASGETDPPQRSGPLTPLLVRMLAARPGDRPTMAEVVHELRLLGPAGSEAAPAPGARRTTVLPAVSGVAATSTLSAVPAAPVVDDPGPEAEDPLWQFREGEGADREGAGPGGRRRRPLLAVLALMAVLALLGIGLATRQGDPPAAAEPGRATTRSASPSATASATRSAGPTARTAEPSPPAPSTSAPAAPTPTRKPSSTPAPTATAPAGGNPTTSQLSAAVQDYYALLPGNLDAGWARLTQRYQRTTAGSRSTFESFWGAIDRVRVSDVGASSPDKVTATVRYDYADGRVYVERTAYRLVEQGGVLKIDRSSVLSSEQR